MKTTRTHWMSLFPRHGVIGVNAHPITAALPGKSITAYTTFQLADDADGITQE